MKTYTSDRIRNIVLMGGPRSGKTTLSEAMLFEGKVIDRRGSVEAKNTVSDNTEIEQTNQRSIFATPLYAEFMDHKFNFIDAPGADDFIGGMISAFKVCDAGVMLVNSQAGVEVGTEIHGRYAEKYNMPMVIAVSQLDSEKADWHTTIDSLHKAFEQKPVVVQYPVNPGPEFNSFIDVKTMKMYKFTDDNGTRQEFDIPADQLETANKYRGELVEIAATASEELMDKYFETGDLSWEEMNQGLNTGFAKGEIYPIFCLSAKKDIGVKRIMEFIINVAPAPKEKAEGPASLFFYKTAVEQHLGEVSYFKVMNGKLTEGMDLVNPATGEKERLSAIYAVAGKKKEKVTELNAGDLGCTVKLKTVKTDQTLNQPGYDVVVPPVEFPQAKFRTAIKAKDEKDEEKLGEALNRSAAEDPTIVVEYSKELKQTIINCQGEQHLNILKWRLNNEYKIEVDFFAPKIPYRETITKVANATYRHKKQSGGAGQFGEVTLLVEPYVDGAESACKFKIDGKEQVMNVKGKETFDLPWGGKWEFYNCIVGGAIDASFMPAIKKGIQQKLEEGPLTGSYARDIRIFVYDGKMHPVDSKEIAFIIAGRNAFKDAFRNAGPKIMEPIFNIEITVPGDCVGDVMSDLQNRRGIMEGMDTVKGFQVLKARVPEAELYRYSTTLSSLTSGRATFTQSFAEYQQVPADVQDKLLKAYVDADKDE